MNTKVVYGIVVGILLLTVGWFWHEGGLVWSEQLQQSAQEIAPQALAGGGIQSAPQEQVRTTKQEKISLQVPIKILFLGDMMFDRYIRQNMERHGADFVFGDTDSVLQTADVVVGNLEGPITNNPSKSVGSAFGSAANYVFTFDPSVAELLKKHHVTLLHLGNNHIFNFGVEGVKQTEECLADAGDEFFGDVDGELGNVHVQELGGWKIGFVSYNQFYGKSAEDVAKDVKKIRSQVDAVIVYTHWGKEYENEPEGYVREEAHAFIDAGADVVIGSHPHVIQSTEVYHGKKIYYSLGNFIFDQYFDARTRKGLGVLMTIDPGSDVFNFQETIFTLNPTGQTVVGK